MDKSLFSFHEMDGLVRSLDGSGPKGVRVFPSIGVDLAELRQVESETIHDWFVRCANKFTATERPNSTWQVCENLMILARVEWGKPGKQLRGCSLSALQTQGRLDDYYSDPKIPALYLRMDYDPGTLGRMFTHPLPHVHAWPSDEAPRFATEGMSDNVIVDFLEWLCRHFYHERWVEWVEVVCAPEFGRRYPANQDDPLRKIILAFRESDLKFLWDRRDDVKLIKELLRKEKDASFSLRASTDYRELLAYPFDRSEPKRAT